MIDVVLEDEAGQAIRRLSGEEALSPTWLPGKSDLRYRCLCFVDPYGDTIFNQLQAEVLLQELTLLKAEAANPRLAKVIEATRELAKLCLQEPHQYLRFVGD